MVLCGSQSWPEYTTTCTPNSDTNIFEGTDPTQPDYVGHHPGAALLELQFYPLGWVQLPFGFSCDARQWCAAMTIDSFEINANTLAPNNTACLNLVGDEPSTLRSSRGMGWPRHRRTRSASKPTWR
jgi:hypothetical protein